MSLFDPPASTELHTVSSLTREIRSRIEEGFSSVWVTGELSNVARPASGHIYLTMKDDKASLRGVIYRGVALRLRFDPKDGMEVQARGRLTVYEPRGEYQLAIEELSPKGIGTLELALQQLKEKLAAKGYFDPARKKPLPVFPRSIAIITSATGAAIRDMLELLARRWPVARVLVLPVRVQGEGSAEEIAKALRTVNHLHRRGDVALDAIIVGRGGGSLEDLWSFNEEMVAEAIVMSALPVISAVGHEIDVTIADLVADHRALTPSHAITDLTPDRDELLAGLQDRENRLKAMLVRRVELARERLASALDRRVLRLPLEQIRDSEKRLDDIGSRLHRGIRQQLDRARQRMEATAAQLESLSPLQVLKRGYSLTLNERGLPVRAAGDATVGERLRTRVAAGEIISRVESIQPQETDRP
ncbi:exodeoxyribonuclease VII large subunit [Zavarzinella formosa]|uniref:exodeoxyribonuclease VII large subunit n=1 Tax=Zavarzinella formosa TaxID=360055 RepID=UPI000375973D|nr:exodeoxyribonuclease VII large subunit [Zavarzinella formosa]